MYNKTILRICILLLISFEAFEISGWTGEINFGVISDTHFYDTELVIEGLAFENYLKNDRKLLKESQAILESTIDSLLDEEINFLLITGDLTKDGALTSHQKFASYLKILEENNIEVYVIPGNHDINNSNALSYKDDTATRVLSISPKDFENIYYDFGYAQALDRDEHSLSYVVEPIEGLWLIGLDSCRYEDSKVLGYPVTAGRISIEIEEWCLEKLQEAKTNQKFVIGFMHHGILEHFKDQSIFFESYVINDWKNVSESFAEAGLKLVFTGHFHAQDATEKIWFKNGLEYSITDIETGSLVSYPCPYRIVSINQYGYLNIQSELVTQIDYDTGKDTFQNYSWKYLYNGVIDIVKQLLTLPIKMGGFGLSKELVDQVAPMIANSIMVHFSGNDTLSEEINEIIMGYLESNDTALVLIGYILQTIWTDLPPSDNDLSLNLNSHRINLNSSKIYYESGDKIEIKIKAYNPSDNTNDIYIILMHEGNNYYYPAWKKTPSFMVIKPKTRFEKIITTEFNNTIPKGTYIIRGGITEHDSPDIFCTDSLTLTIK